MTRRPYGPFPYSPIISRPALRWPNGARLAVWVVLNVEFFALDESVPAASGGSGGPVPDVPTWSVRDYGNRVGIFRLMRLLERRGVPVTAALNADLCDHHPQIVTAGMASGWEFMGHCLTNSQRLNTIPPGEEAGLIRQTLDRIEAATGTRPKGWLGAGLQETWQTLDLLAGQGCTYVADWVNDDQPYVMALQDGKSLVSIPYSYEINDKTAVDKHGLTGETFGAMIKRQFDTLYEEGGGVMAICLHPYITGVPHRVRALDDALAYIIGHQDVWLATGGDIVAAYLAAGAGA